MNAWEKMEVLREAMGAENLLDNLAAAMPQSQLKELMEYVARCWDVNLEDAE